MNVKLLSGLNTDDMTQKLNEAHLEGYRPVYESYRISVNGNHYIFIEKGD